MEHPVTQGSEAWHKLRNGIPTASEFDQLVTPEFKLRTGQMPQTYLCQKLAEHLTGYVGDDGQSFAMNQGSLLESEAVPFYELMFDVEVRRIGFVTDDAMRIGCSPDGLIGEDSGLEIKCPRPDTHIRYLLDGVLPSQYAPQVHGSMFVTGRSSWVFMSYCRKLPPLVVTVERDDAIQAALKSALNGFLARFDAALEKIERLSKVDRAETRAAQAG
jgi:hypothetical protein